MCFLHLLKILSRGTCILQIIWKWCLLDVVLVYNVMIWITILCPKWTKRRTLRNSMTNSGVDGGLSNMNWDLINRIYMVLTRFCVSSFHIVEPLSVTVSLLCSQAGTIASTSTSRCDATSSSSCCRRIFPPRSWWCFHGCRSGSTAGLCRPEFPWVK